jgi:hypothetical protein
MTRGPRAADTAIVPYVAADGVRVERMTSDTNGVVACTARER